MYIVFGVDSDYKALFDMTMNKAQNEQIPKFRSLAFLFTFYTNRKLIV